SSPTTARWRRWMAWWRSCMSATWHSPPPNSPAVAGAAIAATAKQFPRGHRRNARFPLLSPWETLVNSAWRHGLLFFNICYYNKDEDYLRRNQARDHPVGTRLGFCRRRWSICRAHRDHRGHTPRLRRSPLDHYGIAWTARRGAGLDSSRQ